MNSDFVDGFILAAFPIIQNGTRFGDILTTLSLSSAAVQSTLESGVEQFEVHVGSQLTNLAAGLEFDSFRVDYTLVSSTAQTEIGFRTDFLFGYFNVDAGDFFRNPLISYRSVATAAVPLPAGLPLLAGALGAIGLIRRRKSRA